MLKIFNKILKIFLILTIFSLTSLWFIQQDRWFIDQLEIQISKNMTDQLGFKCDCKVKDINLFIPKITLDNITLNSTDSSNIISSQALDSDVSDHADWSISSQNVSIKASWISWLFTGLLSIKVNLANPKMFSTLKDHNLSIIEPIKQFMALPTTFFSLDSVVLKKANLTVKSDFGLNCNLAFSSDIGFQPLGCSILFNLLDGSLEYKNLKVLKSLKGINSLFFNFAGSLESARGEYNGLIDHDLVSGEKPINISWVHNLEEGNLLVYSSNQESKIKLNYKKIGAVKSGETGEWSINGSVNSRLAFFYKLPISGNLIGKINALYTELNGLNYDFVFKTNNIVGADYNVGKFLIKGTGNLKDAHGIIKLQDSKKRLLEGSWNGKIDPLKARVYLSTASKSSYANNSNNLWGPLDTKNSFLKIYLTNKLVKANCLFLIENSNKIFTANLNYDYINNNFIDIDGNFDKYNFLLELKNNPFMLNKFYLTDKNSSKKLIKFNSGENNLITNGSIDWNLIKDAIEFYTGYNLLGSAIFDCNLHPFSNGFKSKISLTKSKLNIPLINNMFTQGSAVMSINWPEKQLLLEDLIFKFNRGTCESPLSIFGFTNTGEFSYAHMPLVFDNCFINFEKNFSGLFSGELTANYNIQDLVSKKTDATIEINSPKTDLQNTNLLGSTELSINPKNLTENDLKLNKSCMNQDQNSYLVTNDNQWQLDGEIIVNRSRLKANLLSPEFQNSFSQNNLKSLIKSDKDINLSIKLITKKPLLVKADILSCSAMADLLIQGTLFNPKISGNITILNGALNFPYQKLFIKSGKLILNNNQNNSSSNICDISIELTAQNTVKNYLVTMTVSGSLSEPNVSFQAPGLTQEQVITLLLAGSEDGSLYWAMPSLVMQYIKSLIFGSSGNSIGFSSLKSLMANFKKIKLVSPPEQASCEKAALEKIVLVRPV